MLVVGPGGAQEPERRYEQVPRFQTGVVTVLVDVLVLHENGTPVMALQQDDFEVYEDGVRQTITSFDVTDWTSYVGLRDSGEPQPGSLNHYPRRFVFVLNRQGADFGYLVRAKKALRSFVVESMADGDEAMVVDMGNSVKILQEFRNTKEETLQSLEKFSPMPVPYMGGLDRATRYALQTMEELGITLQQTSGRKVIVFFSTELATFTMPGSRRTNEGFQLERSVNALNQANASVYTIDLRGPYARGGDFLGGLSPLASQTGGRFFRLTPSFEAPLARIGTENQRYYLLSYTPANADMDGTYRQIEVRVKRPDVRAIARRGYFARSSKAKATETDAAAAVEETAPEPASTADLAPRAVEMTTYLLPTGTVRVRVLMAVSLPPELLSGSDDAHQLTLTISQDGRELDSQTVDVDREHPYAVRTIELIPGPYLLQTSLEASSSQLYQASTEFNVPSGFGQRFGLSSIVPVASPQADAAGELQPLPSPAIARGTDAHLLFYVLAGRRDPARRARLTYTIFAGSDRLRTLEHPEPIELDSTSPEGTPVIIAIPTSKLGPGRYRVEVAVEDTARGRKATGDIELHLR